MMDHLHFSFVSSYILYMLWMFILQISQTNIYFLSLFSLHKVLWFQEFKIPVLIPILDFV